jgi:hypothetical protein
MADTLSWSTITITGPDDGIYKCRNLLTLYSQAYRGEDRLVPGTAGIIKNPRRLAPVDMVLELIISGTSHVATRNNIAALRAAVQPITTGTGTRLVTWTHDAGTQTANAHVGPLTLGVTIGPKAVKATLDLRIGDGDWT